MELHYKGRLLALPTIFLTKLEMSALTNALAYNNTRVFFAALKKVFRIGRGGVREVDIEIPDLRDHFIQSPSFSSISL
jgi:hypothetical protein